MLFHALRASNKLAIERGRAFDGFEDSTYASGEFFDKYIDRAWEPADREGHGAVRRHPHPDAGRLARAARRPIQEHGIYNQNLQAVPPTGSISYINNSTSSIHPIASKIEIRKEGKLGRVYYPAPFMTNDNLEYYQDAYEIGYEKVIDTYAAATQHVDQGLSLTLFFKDTATDARHQQGADLRVAQGHQDDLLHPPAADGARGHRHVRVRQLHAVIA